MFLSLDKKPLYILCPNSFSSKSFKLENRINNNLYSFFYSNIDVVEINGLKLIIDGYILPRNYIYEEYKDLDPFNLIAKLYSISGSNFISNIKGVFKIFIIKENQVEVFTDHLGLAKLFYIKTEKSIFISNNISLLNKCETIQIDDVSLKVKSLLNRNINGKTIFKNVFYTNPASFLKIEEKSINYSKYWDYKSLLNKFFDNKITVNSFESIFKKNISNFFYYIKPRVSLVTLTAGNDSRTTLTVLLNQNIKPIGFTYGTDNTKDVIYGKKIAKVASIDHHVVNPIQSIDWYELMTKKIFSFGNPEINIHRSHRLNSFIELSKIAGKNSAFFPGYVGGELFKGLHYDNLVLPDFISNYWHSQKITGLNELLRKNFHCSRFSDYDMVLSRLFELDCMKKNLTVEEYHFHALFELIIPHHFQDIYLSSQYFNYTYPVFIDLDFIEPLFRSRYSFLNTLRNFKLTRHYKQCFVNLKLQHAFYPKLDDTPFGKKGNYTTKEFLYGNFLWLIIRGWRFLFERTKFSPTFSYDESYIEFLLKCIEKIKKDRDINLDEFYDLEEVIKSLNNSKKLKNEKDLLRYSNIVITYFYTKQADEIIL